MSDGVLVLVATPIGNLGDTSARAIETLKSADVIACEDTRHTRKLLNHFDIRDVPVISVHEHNELSQAQAIVERVGRGDTVALVTDAGMPAISDPGERVVAAVAEAGLNVSVIPGPSAAPAALAVSGLATERFCFEGFLPAKGSDRKRRLGDVSMETRTTVLYEAPHRLARTVTDLSDACGSDRRVVLVRELTKVHEEVWRGDLAELSQRLAVADVKGECVLVLDGKAAKSQVIDDDAIREALQTADASGLTKKAAIVLVADSLGVPKNRVYDVATQ